MKEYSIYFHNSEPEMLRADSYGIMDTGELTLWIDDAPVASYAHGVWCGIVDETAQKRNEPEGPIEGECIGHGYYPDDSVKLPSEPAGSGGFFCVKRVPDAPPAVFGIYDANGDALFEICNHKRVHEVRINGESLVGTVGHRQYIIVE